MLRKILLPTILMILAVGSWNSANFKEIAAGVVNFLFGMISLEQGFNLFTGGILVKSGASRHRVSGGAWDSVSSQQRLCNPVRSCR